MRLARLFLTAAVSLAAVAAAAQESTPPAAGLSDLNSAVDQLEDAPNADAQPPAETETPAEAPAEAEAPAVTEAPEETQTQEDAPPAASLPPGPLTAEQTAGLAAAGTRGQLLIALARAGILGTQDMLSRVSDPEGAGIAGWIARPQGNSTDIIFYANGEAGPVAVYRANVLGGRVVSRDVFLGAERPALDPIPARMAAARDATDGLDRQACGGQPFNVLVVPPANAEAPVDVYQMSPATQRGRFPLGGHYKSTVAADGTVTPVPGFSGACADLAAAETPAGQTPTTLDVAAPSVVLPNELHVFLSLWTGHPLRVAAGDPPRTFLVVGERITEAGE